MFLPNYPNETDSVDQIVSISIQIYMDTTKHCSKNMKVFLKGTVLSMLEVFTFWVSGDRNYLLLIKPL